MMKLPLEVTFASAPGSLSDGVYGDVTVSTGTTVWTINNGVVTNAKMAAMPSNTIKANATGLAAAPTDIALSVNQLLGRGASGDIAPIILGANLSMSGTTLNAAGGGGGGVTDGDKGDIVVSGVGTVWTLDPTAASLANKQPLSTVLTNTTASYTAAEQTKLAGIAAGATVNSADATLLARANHTGTQSAATITGLAAVATSGSAADLTTGIIPAARFDDTAHGSRAGGTLHANAVASGASGFMTGADKTKLDGIAAGAQVNVGTNIAYTAATRALASSTGTGATLPIVTTADAGLAPASGGGTTNFLRADGTWAAAGGGSPVTVQDEGVSVTTTLGTLNFVGAGVTVTGGATATVTIPGGGGGGVTDGDKGDITVSGGGAVWTINPAAEFGINIALRQNAFFN